MIKVLIVDDHHLFAEGMKSLFTPDDGIQIVAQSQNGNEVPTLLQKNEVDVILMDIDMPIIDGIESIQLLKEHNIDIPILMLTMHQSIQKIKKAFSKGAQGYILKDASKIDLVAAIKKVYKGENYFHAKINDQIFDYLRGKKESKTEINQLSSREKEVVKCLAKGMNSKNIGKALFISEHTVRTHRRNIMHKLQVKTSVELIQLAIKKDIIEID